MITDASLHRIRLFYGAYFAAMGLVLPFFPIYLDFRGLDAAMIGFMTGLLALAKVIAPPWIGHLLDRRPAATAHRFITIASWLAAVTAALIASVNGLALLAVTILLFGIFWAAVLPLTDGLSVTVSERDAADYGRLRLWGSIGFVIASLACGAWLSEQHIDNFPYLLAGLMIILAIASRGFPILEQHNDRSEESGRFPRTFYLLLLLAFLMQISHGAYYGFFSLYLADAGFSGIEIGAYWVIGVFAEIVLMWRWSKRLQQLAPAWVFAACLALAALRWLGTGLTSDVVWLALLQLLHAASFAAFHVAAIAWVKRFAPAGRHAAAQGLFSAAGFGLGSTIGIMGSGMIVAGFGYAPAFYICAVIAAIGAALSLLLPKARLQRETI